jgi:hypothetical protein
MQRQFRYRPQLEVLEDRLAPAPLMPPQSHAFGKSLEEWGVLYSRWAIDPELVGGETGLSDTVGRVRFLPTVLDDTGSFEFSVKLRPGTPFVVLPFFVYGERYDDPAVPDDTPQDVIDLRIFETADIQTVLDGRVVLEGTGTELARFMFGPVFFDEPLVYAEPQPRGPDLNATAALFVQGIATVFHPLPVGQHTLVTTVQSEFFGDFQFTYHIKVSPR